MSDLYKHAMHGIFGAFIRGAPELMRAIDVFAGDVRVVEGTLTFTIPALFEFAHATHLPGDRSAGSDRAAYLRFRKSLYGHCTNRQLKVWGGRVEVVSAHADHDRSLYRLVREQRAE